MEDQYPYPIPDITLPPQNHNPSLILQNQSLLRRGIMHLKLCFGAVYLDVERQHVGHKNQEALTWRMPSPETLDPMMTILRNVSDTVEMKRTQPFKDSEATRCCSF